MHGCKTKTGLMTRPMRRQDESTVHVVVSVKRLTRLTILLRLQVSSIVYLLYFIAVYGFYQYKLCTCKQQSKLKCKDFCKIRYFYNLKFSGSLPRDFIRLNIEKKESVSLSLHINGSNDWYATFTSYKNVLYKLLTEILNYNF